MKPLIVITGASSGIGLETALKFASAGHPLALLARRKEKLEKAKQQIKTPCFLFPVDVRDSKTVFETIDQIESQHGPIDLLVNNAGGAFGMAKSQEALLEDWETCVDTNVKGLLYATHHVLPYMIKRNRGHIINIGSIAGSYAYPGGNVYGGCKAFVHHFSLNLRADLLGTKIRVSCIEPGLTTGSEFSLVRFKGNAAKAQEVYSGTEPLLATDIAETIYFCYQMPSHVNINTIEMMPTTQASTALAVHREKSN